MEYKKSSQPPARILVAEDEQIVALELQERLTRAGHQVPAIVASAREAILAAERIHPDLALMDIKLQGDMDGIDAARVLRHRDIPVVYLTAFADEQTLERAKATEPYGYVLKPFRDRELHIAVEMALHRHEIVCRLRESEAWRHALLRSAGSAVLATGKDRRIKFMNPVAEALTGWREAEAVGLELDRVFHVVESPESGVSPTREPARRRLIARSGATLPIEAELAPIRDSGGHDLGHVWVFRDVSERERQHDRQRFMAAAGRVVSSSLDQETLFSKITDLIVRSQADLVVVHLRDDEENGQLRVSALCHAHADLSGLRARVLHRPVPAGGSDGCVERALRGQSSRQSANAGPSWLAGVLGSTETEVAAAGLTARSAMCVPLTAFGKSLGALTLVLDRPDRTFLEEDLLFAEELGSLVAAGIGNARQYALAQRAIRMREDVLAIVSHDLKTPLQTICLSAAQLDRAAGGVPPESVRTRARSIGRSAGQMARLIDDLLDVACIDSGRLSLQQGPHRAGDILAEAAALFEVVAAARKIEITIVGPPPEATVLCDHHRVLQVFSNLIGNALKLGPEGKPVRIQGDILDGMVHFQVADEAGGIAPDQVPHIFAQYWQAPETRRQGTGLGLYIARGLVEAHGGRIWVDTVHGVGSTFHFTLPVAPSPRQAQSCAEDTGSAARQIEADDEPGPARSIQLDRAAELPGEALHEQ